MKHNKPRRQHVELFLDEEENLNHEGSASEENRVDGEGNNTTEQRRLGLDIGMIGAREEELGRTRSQTQEMFSPRNESMERAELTMEEWIQVPCLISAVTSAPTESKSFQEAWHSPIEKERENWTIAIKKEIRRQTEKGYLTTEDLLEIGGYLKSIEMGPTEQDL